MKQEKRNLETEILQTQTNTGLAAITIAIMLIYNFLLTLACSSNPTAIEPPNTVLLGEPPTLELACDPHRYQDCISGCSNDPRCLTLCYDRYYAPCK